MKPGKKGQEAMPTWGVDGKRENKVALENIGLAEFIGCTGRDAP